MGLLCSTTKHVHGMIWALWLGLRLGAWGHMMDMQQLLALEMVLVQFTPSIWETMLFIPSLTNE